MNKVLHGDCLELLSDLQNKSVDMILTDPPYGTTNCKWDTPINLPELWKQYSRVIKDNGAIVMFAQSPFDKVLASSNLEMFRYEWIWEKTEATGFLNSKRMPLKAHENLLVFYKSLPVYNPQMLTNQKPVNSFTRKAEVSNRSQIYGKVNKTVSGGGSTDRYPRSVIRFAKDKQKNMRNGTLHPTQKPVSLCEYLIKTYTNENEVVLDTFAGSGTVGIAAHNTKRQYILMEKDKNWYDMCLNRLQKMHNVVNNSDHAAGCSWHKDWHACDCGLFDISQNKEQGKNHE